MPILTTASGARRTRRKPVSPSPELEDGTQGWFHPPSQPVDWTAQDTVVGEYLALRPCPGPTLFAGEPCGCGGRWRYVLAGSAAHPIWRCLHCGAVHRDHARFA